MAICEANNICFVFYELPKFRANVCTQQRKLLNNSNNTFYTKENNAFSMTANVSYGPLMNTNNNYYRTFSSSFLLQVMRCSLCDIC